MQTKTILMAILAVLVIIAGAFYWYEYRPTQIRKECGITVSKVANEAKLSPSEGSTLLNFCIKKHGLEK